MVLMLGVSPLFAQKPPAETGNAGVSIWTHLGASRMKERDVPGYTKRWDLSDMPHYVPKQ